MFKATNAKESIQNEADTTTTKSDESKNSTNDATDATVKDSEETDFKFIDTIPTCDEKIKEIREDITEIGDDMIWISSKGRKGSFQSKRN